MPLSADQFRTADQVIAALEGRHPDITGLWTFLTQEGSFNPTILDKKGRRAIAALIELGFAEKRDGVIYPKTNGTGEQVGAVLEEQPTEEEERVLKGLRNAGVHGISRHTLEEMGLLQAAIRLKKTDKVRTGKNPEDGATHYYLVAE